MRTPLFGLILLLPALAGCESSMRLGTLDNPFGNSGRIASRPTQPPAGSTFGAAPTTQVDTAPLTPVTRQDLAPPPGTPVDGGLNPPPQAATPPAMPEPPKVAAVEPPKTAAAQVDEPAPRPTQTSVTGNWAAREASGASCKVTLSSSPKLDLYGASTSGCQSKDLQKVVAWELRGEDVYLYQPGGAVAARLKARGRQMDGSLAQSGAPISLSK